MKKILIISTLPPPFHGVTIYNEMLLDSKIHNFFDIYHLDISDHRNLDNLGKIDLNNVLLSIKNFISLFYLIIKKKPDLVYLVISQSLAYLRDGAFILVIHYFSGAKIIAHLHGSYFKKYYSKSNWFIKKIIDLTLSKVDTTIVLGNCLKYIFNGWARNCEVVPNGTDFNPDISKKSFVKKKNIIIGFLSNLIESKGVLDLLEAADITINKYKYKDIKIKFAGSWQDEKVKNKCLEFIRINKLDNYIEFTGLVIGKDKEKFLIETDIFVFPTWYKYEGHPIVILEAMAAACPVISSKDVGAIFETVIDGETGILVEKKNPKEIAGAIIYLIKHHDERVRMGLAGRKRFEENYTLEKNINNMIKIFDEVCHG